MRYPRFGLTIELDRKLIIELFILVDDFLTK